MMHPEWDSTKVCKPRTCPDRFKYNIGGAGIFCTDPDLNTEVLASLSACCCIVGRSLGLPAATPVFSLISLGYECEILHDKS